MPSPTLRSARPNTGADPELAAALRRCAERDPGGLADLEARCGQRLRAVLARALGDVALADRALPAALADLEEHAAEFDPDREAADDWIFGRTRCRLRALSASGKADATRRVRATRRPSHGAGGRRGSPAADPPGAVPRPMAGGATAPDRPVPSRPGPSSRPAETTPEHRDGRAKRALST